MSTWTSNSLCLEAETKEPAMGRLIAGSATICNLPTIIKMYCSVQRVSSSTEDIHRFMFMVLFIHINEIHISLLSTVLFCFLCSITVLLKKLKLRVLSTSLHVFVIYFTVRLRLKVTLWGKRSFHSVRTARYCRSLVAVHHFPIRRFDHKQRN